MNLLFLINLRCFIPSTKALQHGMHTCRSSCHVMCILLACSYDLTTFYQLIRHLVLNDVERSKCDRNFVDSIRDGSDISPRNTDESREI
jgi:hypothetical protein